MTPKNNERDLKAEKYANIPSTPYVNTMTHNAYCAGWDAALESEAVKDLVRLSKEAVSNWGDYAPSNSAAATTLRDLKQTLESFTKAKGG